MRADLTWALTRRQSVSKIVFAKMAAQGEPEPEPQPPSAQAASWAKALPQGLRRGWDATVASAADAHPRWSRGSRKIPRSAIAATAGWCSLPHGAIAACQAFADWIAESDRLTMISRHLHSKMFPDGEGSLASGAELPDFPAEIDGSLSLSETATLYLLLFLTGVPALLAHHRERRIPEDVTRLTLSDIGVWVRAHATGSMSPVHQQQQQQASGQEQQGGGGTDASSFGLSNLAWPMHSLNGSILRVGRFQHRRGTFNAPFEMYRHRSTGAVQVRRQSCLSPSFTSHFERLCPAHFSGRPRSMQKDGDHFHPPPIYRGYQAKPSGAS
jgi:hypothetical protein